MDPTTAEGSPRRRLAHPPVVTISIGCWAASAVLDVVSNVVAAPGLLTRGSSWLVGIGLLAAIVASVTGIRDALPIPPRTRANTMASVHLALAMVAVVLYLTSYLVRLAAPDDQPVSVPLTAFSALCALVLIGTSSAGWLLAHRAGLSRSPAGADERVR